MTYKGFKVTCAPIQMSPSAKKTHTASITTAWLHGRGIQVLDWPACSPNICGIIKCKFWRRYRTVEQLESSVRQEWDNIPLTVVNMDFFQLFENTITFVMSWFYLWNSNMSHLQIIAICFYLHFTQWLNLWEFWLVYIFIHQNVTKHWRISCTFHALTS